MNVAWLQGLEGGWVASIGSLWPYGVRRACLERPWFCFLHSLEVRRADLASRCPARLEMLLVLLAPTAFSTHRLTGAQKAASTASQAAAGRSRRHTMLAEGLPKAVVFDLDGCLWAPDMCA